MIIPFFRYVITIIKKVIVLKVEVHEDKTTLKALKAVAGISGVESVSMDMKDKELTLTGNVDAVQVAAKLRKFCPAKIVSISSNDLN